jgi:AraC-like DNA-binding protein
MDMNSANSDDLLSPQRSSYAPSQTGEVRIGPILAIPAVLTAHEIRPDLAFARAGIDGKLFRDPESRLPLEAVGRLLDICVALTRCPHFGLLVGERFNLDAFGAIGALMRNSTNVNQALGVLLRHLHLHDRGASPVLLAPDKSSVMLGYSIFRHGMPGSDQIYDAAITIAYKIVRELCGPSFTPLQIQFAHGRPANVAPFAHLFRSNVVFDADLSGVVVDASLLSRPMKGADADLRIRLEKAILDAEADCPMSFADRVECAIHQLVPTGPASAEEICHLLAISERTLRRRLKDEGKSLQELFNQTRYALARQLLSNTRMPVSKIAAALQFGDPNVFSRAFRAWAGLSPTQWRSLELKRGEEARSTTTTSSE